MKNFKVAIAGADNVMGQEILKILAEREFPVKEAFALAPAQTAGGEVSFGDDDTLKILNIALFDFHGIDICFFCTSSAVSAEYVTKAAAAGCIAIDCSSQFSMDPDVPLIVPEINLDALKDYTKRHIIANPNSQTIQMLVALKPLHDLAIIKRIVVSTYQSVADLGREAMDELFRQTRAIFVNDELVKEQFHKQIAFNVIPQVDDFMDDGSTKQEWKLVVETKKILGTKIKVAATCVRVPVFVCNAESVNVEFENPMSADEARTVLKRTKSLCVVDRHNEDGFVTPVECTGEDQVYVSRIRDDISVENGINLWIVGDNLRKGSALNAVQIAEALIKNHLK